MDVLLVGSGGREHALAWKIKQSPRVSEVIVAPGNAGTTTEPGVRNVDIAMSDIDGLVALAHREDIALTVVGPEAPLVAGLVDRFRAEGLRCFGASMPANRILWTVPFRSSATSIVSPSVTLTTLPVYRFGK